ncbi:MAG: BsuBI/PstI family type II restriction endonuclease [Anaerolineae bacterium]
MTHESKLIEGQKLLESLGFPTAQQNERSVLTLLALVNLAPEKSWRDAESRLIGITPIMEFAASYYQKTYKANTRESVRKETMHQFVEAGLALLNPDDPSRAINSPKTVYQIEPSALNLIRLFGTDEWPAKLQEYLQEKPSLAARYASARNMQLIPVQIGHENWVNLSAGNHSELIKAIIDEFAPRFVPGSILIYAGDTGDKWGYFDEQLLEECGVVVNAHGKMPDVILYVPEREWLILVEAVTSRGPVDSKRKVELSNLFQQSKAGLVFVTAFPTHKVMNRFLNVIAWETEVWVADHPTHLIHFDGIRFLGPYIG